jgi:hypothetical protein
MTQIIKKIGLDGFHFRFHFIAFLFRLLLSVKNKRFFTYILHVEYIESLS